MQYSSPARGRGVRVWVLQVEKEREREPYPCLHRGQGVEQRETGSGERDKGNGLHILAGVEGEIVDRERTVASAGCGRDPRT